MVTLRTASFGIECGTMEQVARVHAFHFHSVLSRTNQYPFCRGCCRGCSRGKRGLSTLGCQQLDLGPWAMDGVMQRCGSGRLCCVSVCLCSPALSLCRAQDAEQQEAEQSLSRARTCGRRVHHGWLLLLSNTGRKRALRAVRIYCHTHVGFAPQTAHAGRTQKPVKWQKQRALFLSKRA